MDPTERLVQTWMASGREEELKEIVSEISEDRGSLLTVVKALGYYLTSEDGDLLEKGVELLSLIVARVPQEKLNRQSARVLSGFFCGKLEDSATLKPALGGLVTLAQIPTLSPAEVVTIVDSLFRHVKMKAIVQGVRFEVFSIIDSLMAFHRDVLKSMGKHFLDGYIGLAEGEKDPRNLMVAFAIARVILIEFDITLHVESMFNILFCYFPITFRPPPNDRYGISTEDLRLSLRRCLNATPSFGPLAIPVFLEKVSVGSRTTKKDTLQSLASCLPVYGPALARVSARKLWNALKLEIFQPVDPETEEEALKTMQILVKIIYADEEAAMESNDDIQGLARDACEECIQILKEPEKSQAKPAIKILCTFMSTTPSVSRYTISQAVPHLVRLFHDPDEISARAPTTFLLSELIASARDAMDKEPSLKVDPPLLPFKDEVLGVLTTGASLPATRTFALSGLKALVSTKGLLSDEELGFIVHNADQIIEKGADYGDSSEAILDLLVAVGARAPHHLAEQTLPLLFGYLPDKAPLRDAAAEREKCWLTLSTLRSLCLLPDLFENMVIRLITKLDLISFPYAAKPLALSDDPEPSAAYAHMILKTLAQCLATKVNKKHADVSKYIDRLVPSLFNIFVASAFISDEGEMIATDPRLIQVAGEIITLVVQSLSPQRQQAYSVGLGKALRSGDVADIASGFQKIASTRKLSLFEDTSSSAQKNILSLLTAAVIPLDKEVRLSLGDIDKFLDSLLTWVLEIADTDLQRISALRMIASILNKHVDELTSFLKNKLDVYWSERVSGRTLATIQRIWAIKSWTWITKGLLVRKHPLAMTFVERLYGIFDDESVGWEAAKAIGEIPSTDVVLTKANRAEVKILFVQKYAGSVLPEILAFAKDSSNPAKQTASLVALTSLIKSIPRAAYAHEMPSLIPLLLRGLDLPDAEIRGNVIDTFLAAAEGESPEKSLVSEHSVTLVNAMLRNSKVGDMTSTRVRTSALRYLGILPSIVRYDVLHPYKSTVLRELADVLDDPKRSVRKEAVDARTNWFKYKG